MMFLKVAIPRWRETTSAGLHVLPWKPRPVCVRLTCRRYLERSYPALTHCCLNIQAKRCNCGYQTSNCVHEASCDSVCCEVLSLKADMWVRGGGLHHMKSLSRHTHQITVICVAVYVQTHVWNSTGTLGVCVCVLIPAVVYHSTVSPSLSLSPLTRFLSFPSC